MKLTISILFSICFICNYALAFSNFDINSLNKNNLVVYDVKYNNIDLSPDDEWVAIKQLETFGFKPENIIHNRNFNRENYGEYFKALDFTNEISNKLRNISTLNSLDPNIERGICSIYLLNKYFPSPEISNLLYNLHLNYNLNQPLSKHDLQIINNNKELMLKLSNISIQKSKYLIEKMKPFDNRYIVHINLTQEFYSDYKTAYENYQDILAINEQGFATEDQLSVTKNGDYFSIRITFIGKGLYFDVVKQDGLWMGICNKYLQQEIENLTIQSKKSSIENEKYRI